MNSQSFLTSSSLPIWTENHPSGFINMESERPSRFKPTVLKYNYALNSTKKIMNTGDNSIIKFPRISSKEKKLKKTIPVDFEDFMNPFIYNNNSEKIGAKSPKIRKYESYAEKFLVDDDGYSHGNPYFVILFSLIILSIMLFIMNK